MTGSVRPRLASRLGTLALLVPLVAGAVLAAAPAEAQRREDRGPAPGWGSRGGEGHFDARWHHDRWYPPRGEVYARAPHDGGWVDHYGRRYWYGGGVWYAPRGPRWIVVGPPIGAFVTVLPPFCTTVWFGGIPYYYANDAYYVWRERDRAYEVVDPPADVSTASTEAPAPDDIYIYPKNGQSAEQQARDRYECHRWAADQTGFDPTRPDGGVPVEQSKSRRAEYFRAITACLEGRGYSVK